MVASRWLFCVAVTVVCGASPKEKKKLRNVIITSFGEMPYEPASGFYQSDVFPVGIDGVLKEQTMDVALRTGILVEDPNEKKEEESVEDKDDVTSTNLKRQVSEGEEKGEDERRRAHKSNLKGYEDEETIMGTRSVSEGDEAVKVGDEHGGKFMRSYKRNPKGYGDEEIIMGTRSHSEREEAVTGNNDHEKLLRRSHERNPKGYRDDIVMGTRSFGYEFGLSKKPSMRNYDNLNRGSSRDIGEGWNLRDAEAILQGRNYNLLQTQWPRSYPMPAPREMPPPGYDPRGHPVFYPFPQFDHSFPPQNHAHPQIVPAKYDTRVDKYDRPNSKVQTAEKLQFRDKREWLPLLLNSESLKIEPKSVIISTPQTDLYSDYYLRGI